MRVQIDKIEEWKQLVERTNRYEKVEWLGDGRYRG